MVIGTTNRIQEATIDSRQISPLAGLLPLKPQR